MMTLTMSINKIFEENLQIAMRPFIFLFFLRKNNIIILNL